MNKNQYYNQHRNLDIHKAEMERKWRAYIREQEEMEIARMQAIYEAQQQQQSVVTSPGAGGGGGEGFGPSFKQSFLYWANFNINGDMNNQTYKSSSIDFTDGTTELYDSELTFGDYEWYSYPWSTVYYSLGGYMTRFKKRDNTERVFIIHDAGGKFVDKLVIDTNAYELLGEEGGQWGGFVVAVKVSGENVVKVYYTDGTSKFIEYTIEEAYNVSCYGIDKNLNSRIRVNDGNQWYFANAEKITKVYENVTGFDSIVDTGNSGMFIIVKDSGSNYIQRVDVVHSDHTVESKTIEDGLFRYRHAMPYSDNSMMIMLHDNNTRTYFINYDGSLDKTTSLDYNPSQSFNETRQWMYSFRETYNTGQYAYPATSNVIVVGFFNATSPDNGLRNYQEMDIVYFVQGETEFFMKEFRTPFWSSFFWSKYPDTTLDGFYMDYLTSSTGSGTYDVLYFNRGTETSTTLWDANVSDRSYTFVTFGDSSLLVIQENYTDAVILKNGVVVETLTNLTGVNNNNYNRPQYDGGANRLRWGIVSYTKSTDPSGLVNTWTEWDGKTTSFTAPDPSINVAYGAGVNIEKIGCPYPIYRFTVSGTTYQYVTKAGGAFQVNHVVEDGYSFQDVVGWLSEVIVLYDTNSSEDVAKVSFYSMLTGKLVGSIVTDSPFDGWASGQSYLSFPWGKRTTMVAINNVDSRKDRNKYYGYINGSVKTGYLFPFLADAPSPVYDGIPDIFVRGNDTSY